MGRQALEAGGSATMYARQMSAPARKTSNEMIVRNAFERWNADRYGFIEIVHPDVEISVASSQVTGGQPFLRGYMSQADAREAFERDG